MKTIKDIISDYNLKVENSIIDLGYKNGWINNLIFNALEYHQIPDTSSSVTVSNCVTAYMFNVEDTTGKYTVVYKIDSGD